jgi:hypothetical protein
MQCAVSREANSASNSQVIHRKWLKPKIYKASPLVSVLTRYIESTATRPSFLEFKIDSQNTASICCYYLFVRVTTCFGPN